MTTKHTTLMFKPYFFLCALTIVLFSCDKEGDDTPQKVCDRTELFGIADTSNTLIPLNSQNFWVYTDSLWSNGVLESERSTLLTLDKVYDLAGNVAVQHSSILPLLMLRGDTLVSAAITPTIDAPNCYETYFPMLFKTEDSVLVSSTNTLKYVYPSTSVVKTEVGDFSNNMVYNDGGFYELVLNEQVGIIKISFYITFNSVKMKRRTLTIKDYDIVN